MSTTPLPTPRKPVRPRLLLLDDDVRFVETARRILGRHFAFDAVTDEAGFWAWLERDNPDLLLLDIQLDGRLNGDSSGNARSGIDSTKMDRTPSRTGFDVYRDLRGRGHTVPVIALTIRAGLEVTAEALRLGIPFLQKDASMSPELLLQTVRQVLENDRLRRLHQHWAALMAEPALEAECPWPDSPAGQAVLEGIAAAEAAEGIPADTPAPILLAGEWGTGRRTTARWIHATTTEPEAPFLEITPCGLEPAEFEEELFGLPGAAGRSKPGALRAAEGGTLYISRMTTMNEDTLRRLTEALSSGAYSPVGSERKRPVAARVIGGATPRSLGVTEFAADVKALWGRRTVALPALRDHPDDLRFHADYLERSLHTWRPAPRRLSDGDLARLLATDLPHNNYDLRAALLVGVKYAIDEATQVDAMEWKELLGLQYQEFSRRVLGRYVRGVERLLGRDIEKWRIHTGYSRAAIYKWWKEFIKDE
jgi:DNA-binding NtrC family response regulator